MPTVSTLIRRTLRRTAKEVVKDMWIASRGLRENA